MRNVEIIDRELRNLVSLRWVLREVNGTECSLAGIVEQVDGLLDERNRLPKLKSAEPESTVRAAISRRPQVR